MQLDDAGAAALQTREACRLKAYYDDAGVLTIGWGHTGGDFDLNTVWSQNDADAQFLLDVQPDVDCINALVKVALTQNQFNALVSFVYNVGQEAFKRSTLLAKLNAGMFLSVPVEMRKWVYAGGHFVQGLQNRRDSEINQWEAV
jgi:lysozyme